MFSLLSVILISSRFFNLISSSTPANFIDLTIIDYYVQDVFDEMSIVLGKHSDIANIKIKQCQSCSKIDEFNIKCSKDELLQLEIEVKKDSNNVMVPFNISCEFDKSRTGAKMVPKAEINNISLILKPTSKKVTHYLLFSTDSFDYKMLQIIDEKTFFVLQNLTEKTLYQICIASIDNKWTTSLFRCKRVLTDFLYTGPVTNVRHQPESDRIHLSWSKPDYKYDNPQGYIINVTGSMSFCRVIIIEMTNESITTNDFCRNKETKIWKSLTALEIKNLHPKTQYNVEIFPVNRNKPFKQEKITIFTLEETETVKDLSVNLTLTGWISISFKESLINTEDNIKYKVKIIQTKTNLCSFINNDIYETFFTQTNGQISVDKLKKYGTFMVEVTRIIETNKKEVESRTARAPFIYFNDSALKSSILFDSKFTSYNSFYVHLSWNINEGKSDIAAFIIELISLSNSSNCVTRIIYKTNCPELVKIVASQTKCPYVEMVQRNEESFNSVFTGMFHRKSKYQTKVWIIENTLYEVFSDTVSNEDFEDCFTDCDSQGDYRGLRSADKDGKICIPWKNSNFADRKGYRSNICLSNIENKTWCPTYNSWNYCDIPKCSDIHSVIGCVKSNSIRISNDSLSIMWSPPENKLKLMGYIVLLHNTSNLCQEYLIQLCSQCGSRSHLQIRVNSFYLSCSTGRVDQNVTYQAQFSNLEENKQYFVYIIPIVNQSVVGDVKNISVLTVLNEATTPKPKNKSNELINSLQCVFLVFFVLIVIFCK